MSKKPKTYKSPRRAALAQLAQIKRRLQWCINQWTVESTVYESLPSEKRISPADGKEYTYSNSRVRPRRYDEYPENQAAQWSILYDQANEAAIEAQALAEFAAEQWRRCLAERQAG